jgi:acyl-homoserine-lactone acylase
MTRSVPLRSSMRSFLIIPLVVCASTIVGAQAGPPDIASHVEVRRTEHGVPHIRADNMEAAGYGLGYVQIEDYGARVAMGLLHSRGEMGRWFGRDSIEGDFNARLNYETAVRGYPTLDSDTRAIYDGFAEGVNRYIEMHPEEFPARFAPHFTGYDVLAHEVSGASLREAARFLSRIDPQARRRTRDAEPEVALASPIAGGQDPPDEGSNAWAFAPSRTKSGHAILLRNPHLNWNSGYYEAQLTVPGAVDFYGEFRIGSPFGVVGGFNRDLGWSTTNNSPLLSQIYSLDVDSTQVDHYLLDGASIPLQRQLTTVEFRNGNGLSSETRETFRTTLGPVIYRGNGKIYVLKAAGDGDVRGGEQFLRMMRSHSLAEWKDAMRMRARITSNFTYADRAGNILYVWNASIPKLPLPSGGDTAAVPIHRTSEAWTSFVPFDSLPQLLNPKGGYVENSNDPPYFTNLQQPLDRSKYPAYFPEPRLGLRQQLALSLINNDRKLNLQDVLALKHSYRMLLADRVRDDLVKEVRASNPSPDVARAIDMIAKWDKTVAPASRGGVLFEMWWRKYIEHTRPDTMYAVQWTAKQPASTPIGIRFSDRSVEAFKWAVGETTRRFGSPDVAWGDVHRVRIGTVDVPVGGCNGDIGCFRVLWYKDDPDGKREANGGDGWILAVEFDNEPQAYSVLAYGESSREDSPFHSDQAEMFARGELKRVYWQQKDVDAQTIRRYRPGEKR